MNRAHTTGTSLCFLLILVPSIGWAQETYDGPIGGLTLTEGRRWGWDANSAATIGGFGLFEGWHWEKLRVGLLQRSNWWQGSHGPVLDGGGFVSVDLASVWIEPQISAAFFLRGDPALRWSSNTSKWAVILAGMAGVRAAGVEFGVALTPEYWLSVLPSNANPAGVNLEVRLGFDLFEMTHVVHELCATRAQPTR